MHRIENPWIKRVCKMGRDITGLGNRSNRGKFGSMSEAKKLPIFTRRVRVTPFDGGGG